MRLVHRYLAAVLLASATACSDSDDLSVEIVNFEDDASVEGNVVELDVNVNGIDVATSEDDADGGAQLHVFVDRDPVAEGARIPNDDPDIVRSAANPIRLTGLSVGEHRLVVVLGDQEHKRIGRAAAETSVRVKGPSIDVTGPSSAELGAVIQVEIDVEGVDLVETTDAREGGAAGQLHLFVNKDPTPTGESIPTNDPAIVHTTSGSVAFPADLFRRGNNTIWVMLGQTDNTAFEPLVLDTVDVEVTS